MKRDKRPVDLEAVQADDALLDGLGRGAYPKSGDLELLLAAWRREIQPGSVPDMISTENAIQLLLGQRRRFPWWVRVWWRVRKWTHRTS